MEWIVAAAVVVIGFIAMSACAAFGPSLPVFSPAPPCPPKPQAPARVHGLTYAEAEGLAIFALGRFVDCRTEEGAPAEMLEPFKQAYLNLSARALGQEPLSLRELQAPTGAVSPEDQAALRAMSPAWLPDGERLRLRLLRRRHATSPCSSGPRAGCEPESTPAV